jgi:ketosteroid isomerase-like protein
MSQEKVEIVERLVDAFNRRDDDLQSVLTELDADVEIDDLDISLDSEHYVGHDGARRWIGVWGDAWGSWRIEGLEVKPVDQVCAIALFLMIVTGQGSGIELARRDAIVCTLRAGKIANLTYYNDQQQALIAVGLAE